MSTNEMTQQIVSALDDWKKGTRLLSSAKLEGGISATPYLLEIETLDGAKDKIIARFLGEYAKSQGPGMAEKQFTTLKLLRESGLPCPEALYLPDESEEPFFLMSYLPGAPTANPSDPKAFVSDFAAQLAAVHKTTLSVELKNLLEEPTYPWKHWRTEFNQDLREPEVVEVILATEPKNPNQLVLRHGDFWPGNVLCQEGRIKGVIDWEECCLGDPLADLAISRLDIWWILGREAAEQLTADYLSINPIDTAALTYWDLRRSLRPMANLEEWAVSFAPIGRPDITLEGMKRDLLEFIDLALTASYT